MVLFLSSESRQLGISPNKKIKKIVPPPAPENLQHYARSRKNNRYIEPVSQSGLVKMVRDQREPFGASGLWGSY